MAELLVELFSEEIPARMQTRAADDLRRRVTERLKDSRLAFARAESFATPRRLALVVDGLPKQQPDVKEERKGPRVGAPDKAVRGFLNSVGLTSPDECEQRDTGKGVFYFVTIERKGRPTAEVLAGLIPEILYGFDWPKSMRWANTTVRWVRPLHNVLCLFDGGPVPGGFGLGTTDPESQEIFLPFTDATRGHRFLAPQAIKVEDFAGYRDRLRGAYVMLDAAERRESIRRDAEQVAAEEGLRLKDDPALLEECAGLVEWPVVLIGAIDEAFMDLPPEVLTTSMRTHQKYFALLKPDGGLAPRFILVAGTLTDDGGAAVVAGNERVLRARLADARYFWDRDLRRRLEERVPELAGTIFHERLGSMAEKVERLQTLAAELSEYIPGCDRDLARSAALLCKADLTTEMVGEFPELQGIMGRYYALAAGEKSEVADAIAEHYAPRGPDDRCPTAPVSVAVALADKIDSLVGFFAIGEKPTGSKDPFALRRAALGVIRLIVENRLRIPLAETFRRANHLYAEGGKGPAGRLDVNELLDFFADRLKVHLREKGVRHDLIAAVFAPLGPNGYVEDDLVRLLARVEALERFLGTEDGANLLVAYRRAGNIVRIEERKDRRRYDERVDESLLEAAEERTLHERLGEVARLSGGALRHEEFETAMTALARLRKPVDAFFDRVTVNCEQPDLRANRLRLLSEIRATLGSVADFSQIEG